MQISGASPRPLQPMVVAPGPGRTGAPRGGFYWSFETECDRILWRGVPPPPPSLSTTGMGWYVAPETRKQTKKNYETRGIGIHLDVFLLNPDAQAPIGTIKKMGCRRRLYEEVSLLNPAVQDPAVRLPLSFGY